MWRSISHLIGFAIHATDGRLGKVEDFYFSDQTWTLLYLVANTGRWLSGRRVLIPRVAFGTPTSEAWTFPVRLTMQEAWNSPGVDTHKPVCRQHWADSPRHVTWPFCWVDALLPMACTCVLPSVAAIGAAPAGQQRTDIAPQNPRGGDPHLRSARRVMGYDIQAKDGGIGHVTDFILDDEEWSIPCLVVDTGHWWPRRRVLVSPLCVSGVSWEESKVLTPLSREDVKSCPEFETCQERGRKQSQ